MNKIKAIIAIIIALVLVRGGGPGKNNGLFSESNTSRKSSQERRQLF